MRKFRGACVSAATREPRSPDALRHESPKNHVEGCVSRVLSRAPPPAYPFPTVLVTF